MWSARTVLRALVPAVLVASGASASAHAAPVVGPSTSEVMKASVAKERSCTQRPLEGVRGVASRRWVAPMDGTVTFRLLGGSKGDWDLALFDSGDAALVSSSSAFRSSEIVQANVRRGASLIVQACRRSGRNASVPLQTTFARTDIDEILRLAGEKLSLVEVGVPSRRMFELLERTVDVTHDVHDGHAVVVLREGDFDVLRKLGFTQLDVKVDDLRAQLRADRRAARERASLRAASALPSGRTDYRTYEEIQAELKELADKNPERVRMITLKAKSFQGRDLQAIEIASNVKSDDGRPVFFLNGMHHAREWPSPEGIMEFAREAVAATDARFKALTDNVRIIAMPLTNADGYILSRSSPDPDPDAETPIGDAYSTATGVVIAGGSLAYKRKNCNPVYAPSPAIPCELAIGVDPNRNYGESWGGPGASSNPNDQSYRGSGPFSEPEPSAVKELMSTTNPTSMLTIHTIAGLVLRPPGLQADGFAPDEEALKALGKKMADATGYTNQYGWQLYDTTGTTDDWSYAATAGFGYTIEMGPAGGEFHGNYQTYVIDQYFGTGKQKGRGLREAYLVAAEAAREPAYTSRLAGRAPAGRTLRLTKEFKTLSYPVCQVADPLPVGVPVGEDPTTCLGNGAVIEQPEKLEFTTTVPASGKFEWWINPSTRPFVAKAGKKETYKLTCEDGGKVITEQELFVARGEVARLELPCGGVLPPETTGSAGKLTARLGKLLSPVSVINKRKRAVVRIGVSGGVLDNVRVDLLSRSGKTLIGRATVKRLTKSRRVQVKLRKGKRVKVGTYRLRLTATQAGGTPVRVSRLVKVQRQVR